MNRPGMGIEEIKNFFGQVFVGSKDACMELPPIKKKVKGHLFEVKNWKITRFTIARYDLNHDVQHHFLTFVISGVSISSTLEASLASKILGRTSLRLETKIINLKYLVALQTVSDDIRKMHSKINLEFELLTQSNEKKLKKGLLTLLNKLGINTLIQKTMQNRIDAIFSTQFIKFMKKTLRIGENVSHFPPRKMKAPPGPSIDEEEIERRIKRNTSKNMSISTLFDDNNSNKSTKSSKKSRENQKQKRLTVGFLGISSGPKKKKSRLTSTPLGNMDNNNKKNKEKALSKEQRRKTMMPKSSQPRNPIPRPQNRWQDMIDEKKRKKGQDVDQQDVQPILSQPHKNMTHLTPQNTPHKPLPSPKKPDSPSMKERSMLMPPLPSPDGVMGGPSPEEMRKEISLYREIINDKIIKQKETESLLLRKEKESLHFFLLAMKMMNKGRDLTMRELVSLKDNLGFFDEEEMERKLKELKEIQKKLNMKE